MGNANTRFALAALLTALASSMAFAATPELHFGAKNEFSSGYLSSGGTLGDTRPVCIQQVTWLANLGEYGELSGYGWTVSSLHNRQHSVHREAYNQFETAVYYGYNWMIDRDLQLRSKFGPLWNPMIGYEHAHNCNWGWHFVQSLENPVLTPYVNGLWMVSPTPRSRIRFGLQRQFAFSPAWSVVPSIETVWMDNRRYQSRYGGMPQDRFLGGAFATMTIGLTLNWKFADSWKIFARVRQYDIINSQSRRAVKKQTAYYAKCDYMIFGLGIECNF